MDEKAPGEYTQRFEILRRLALAGVGGDDLNVSVRSALERACALLGLSAGRVILWSSGNEEALNVGFALSDQERKILDELEEELFDSLRRSRRLNSAYLSFGGDSPLSVFTVPLHRREVTFGAVLGAKPGQTKLHSEDDFLESLAAAISLTVLVDMQDMVSSEAARAGGAPSRDIIDRERLKAVMETAVTVNHEINNPLTAALGNVQLILMQSDKLDPDVRRKLEIVEKSAMQIRDVTQRLLSLKEARSVTYAGKEKMIDLGQDTSAEDAPESTSGRRPRGKR